jgi:hypothetical protein
MQTRKIEKSVKLLVDLMVSEYFDDHASKIPLKGLLIQKYKNDNGFKTKLYFQKWKQKTTSQQTRIFWWVEDRIERQHLILLHQDVHARYYDQIVSSNRYVHLQPFRGSLDRVITMIVDSLRPNPLIGRTVHQCQTILAPQLQCEAQWRVCQRVDYVEAAGDVRRDEGRA